MAPVVPSPTPTVGVKAPGGAPGLRMPLDEFQAKKPLAFSLYIQALLAWQNAGNEAVDQDNKLGTSYFQVTGIHGVPPVPWQDDPNKPYKKDPDVGYCTHRSTLFMPWHRPYLMLYEQIIYAYAEDIAKRASGAALDAYLQALPGVRLPYWDWATHVGLPTVLMNDKITVKVPGTQAGTLIDLALDHNPLYSYRFKSEYATKIIQEEMGWTTDGNLNPKNFLESKRCPDLNGVSNQKLSDIQMRTLNRQHKQTTWLLLTSVLDFDQFSCQAWRDGSGLEALSSIEVMHNNIHNFLGTNGEYLDKDYTGPKVTGSMTDVQASSFDPVFWLHHANCDRLVALWQALNTDVVIKDFPSMNPRYNADAQTTEGGKSTMEPWHKTAEHSTNDYYVANDVKDLISTFANGFYYTETPLEYIKDPVAMKKSAYRAIYELYAPNYAKPPPQFRAPGPDDGQVQPPSDLQPEPEAAFTTKTWEVFVRVRAFAVSGTWAVHVFLGEVPENAGEWFLSPNRVGSVSILATGDATTCSNCESHAAGGQIVTGTVPLTEDLFERGVDVNDDDAVTQYLTSNLSWQVASSSEPVPIQRSFDLTVGVSSRIMTIPASMDEAPTFEPAITHPEITAGKDGGFDGDSHVALFGARVAMST